MNTNDVLLESWDRQVKIIDGLAGLVHEGNRHVKPSEDGSALDMQLAHIHQCRRGWLRTMDPDLVATFEPAVDVVGEEWVPLKDLDLIKSRLGDSAGAVRTFMARELAAGSGRMEPYDHPIFYLQHMIWHEGWHAGLIMLALRLNGEEPPEEWEDRNIWGLWRDPEV